MAQRGTPEFSEELFAVMLESCSPTRTHVEALTHAVLRHLPRAADAWAALRKALVRQQELESDENRALWYVLDSLMKHAPHVFVPLVAPRLYDYVVQQMPWHLVGVVSTMGSGALWCDAMIRTWEGVLPPHLFRSVKSFVVQLRSGKELANAMNLNDDGSNKNDDDVQFIDPPATRENMQQLRETWEVFKSFAAEGVTGVKDTVVTTREERGVTKREVTETRKESNTSYLVQVKHEPGTYTNIKTDSKVQDPDSDDDDSDVEYMPEFVKGAKQREMPSLTADGGVPQRARRAARRRPREEE
ncbi:uncharacterized protein TM35_000152890 [Trypanosoma theileri]|uniref:Uncharacterized protein n=1 Tax=Trypanosoma theileri TaxID=67003 RepID=A0A1X0NWE2_9TRYP|nr:uncharacterized protein TM35_000152890 [Trypanosoma theileri]ORC88858.1 hypothetical protein TM35_000152890 [Trypanosoma theileri]